MLRAVLGSSAAVLAASQQAGRLQTEVHPEMWMQVDCTESGCRWEKGAVVLDANWRWVNKNGQNCYMNDNTWNKVRVSLGHITNNNKLKNREFTFDVDVSGLPCGLNGAVYFVEMDRYGDRDGVRNTAGAKYGTGYCDAQCPHDLKFIKGEANVLNWNSTSVPPVGRYGSGCAEMDIWEANSMATAFTPHPCTRPGLTKCEGIACGDNAKGERYMGICDKDGCDYNHFRMGSQSFFGRGSEFAVDSSKVLTVVTQFVTADGTDHSDLAEVRRFYVQDGKVVPNSRATILGPQGGNSVTDGFCEAQKRSFGDVNDFKAKGGLRAMGDALERGMVLVLSLWDDTDVSMQWLDSAYPTNQPPRRPGVLRGPCPGGASSAPAFVRAAHPDSHVVFSQIRVGALGSTFHSPGRRMSNDVQV